jgi:hypothetical protein
MLGTWHMLMLIFFIFYVLKVVRILFCVWLVGGTVISIPFDMSFVKNIQRRGLFLCPLQQQQQ